MWFGEQEYEVVHWLSLIKITSLHFDKKNVTVVMFFLVLVFLVLRRHFSFHFGRIFVFVL